MGTVFLSGGKFPTFQHVSNAYDTATTLSTRDMGTWSDTILLQSLPIWTSSLGKKPPQDHHGDFEILVEWMG